MSSKLLDKKWRTGTVVAVNDNGCGVVRTDDGESFQFDPRGIDGKFLRRNITVGLSVEFQLYRPRTSRRQVAVAIRQVVPAAVRRAKQKASHQNRIKTAVRPKAKAPRQIVRAEMLEATQALGARRIVETFLGPLEILDDARLDGLVVVRRTETGDIMQVSANIVAKPSPRPVLDEESKDETVSEVKTTEGKKEILV